MEKLSYNSHLEEYIKYITSELSNKEFSNKEAIIQSYLNINVRSDLKEWSKKLEILFYHLYNTLNITDIFDYSKYRRNKIEGIIDTDYQIGR